MMIEQFLNYLRYERNASPLTVSGYETNLRMFEDFFRTLEGELTWATVDSDVIRDWAEDMMDKGNKASSVNTKLCAVRSFYRFALSRNLVDRDPAHRVSGPKRDKRLPQFVRETEMNELLDQTAWQNDYESVRARTIFTLFYETGIRLAELIGMEDKDVDFSACQLKVTGKRDKQRIVPFGSELAEMLRQFIEVRDEQVSRNSPALFLTGKGERMSRRQVQYVVKKHLSTVTTLKKRSPHVLRHTFATAMLNNGAGLESVKKLLGHESLATTEVYTHTTFEQLKRVYNDAHPRA